MSEVLVEVVDVLDAERALVRKLSPSTQCGGRSCGISLAAAGGHDAMTFEVRVVPRLALRVGDRVAAEIDDKIIFGAAVQLYFTPALLFILTVAVVARVPVLLGFYVPEYAQLLIAGAIGFGYFKYCCAVTSASSAGVVPIVRRLAVE